MQDVKQDGSGSGSGQQSQLSALLPSLAELTGALRDQAAAISRLAQSNELLVQAMAEAEGIEDERVQTVGLNGRAL